MLNGCSWLITRQSRRTETPTDGAIKSKKDHVQHGLIDYTIASFAFIRFILFFLFWSHSFFFSFLPTWGLSARDFHSCLKRADSTTGWIRQSKGITLRTRLERKRKRHGVRSTSTNHPSITVPVRLPTKHPKSPANKKKW